METKFAIPGSVNESGSVYFVSVDITLRCGMMSHCCSGGLDVGMLAV